MGRRAVKITADTKTLVRAPADVVEIQSQIARDFLERAELAAITLPALCELVWVMARGYDEPRDRIAATLRTLLAGRNTRSDMAAVGAGLRFLDEGGDFADGVIAHEGRRLGAETFVSFDRDAVRRIGQQGRAAQVPE
jgi:predicted nucleic-acid-binding protein